MNKSARWILGVAAIVVISVALVGGGIFFGRGSGFGGYGSNMMGYAANGGQTNMTHAPAPSAGVGSTMMGGGNAAQYGVQPLSISAAQSAVEAYLAGLRNGDLTVGEIIIFDNQAYARIDEKSTGHAALEVLVYPVTLAVYLEPGANMMWNLKYGMMGGTGTGMMGGTGTGMMGGTGTGMMGGTGTGMMGATGTGMMGGYIGGATAAKPNDPMPVTVAQAVETAQGYLDTYLPGAKAETKADAFYGYYTLEILRNGQTAGMLSVNGYTRQVILHTWHGRFIETSAK